MLIHVLSVLPDGSVHWTGTPLPAKLDVRTSLDSEQRRASHQEFQIQSPYLNASAAIASGFLLVCSSKMPPVKQRQAISETPAKGGGGLVETCFSSLGWMVAFPGKRPWLGCCLQGFALIECNLKRDSTD
jgi:hypothetical protein